jgi:hypothetical protein
VERSDRERLREFVLWVYGVFDQLLNEPRYSNLLTDSDRSSLQERWKESGSEFRSLAQALKDVLISDLQAHRLEGAQLRLKLELVSFWWRHFTSSPSLESNRKGLLASIDHLLSSIAAAVGASDAVLELHREYGRAVTSKDQ